MPDSSQILLQTKLQRPSLPTNLVVRSRLVERLNLELNSQLILISAPAGFGKTTLAVTWLEWLAANPSITAASLPFAWISLDENDSELNLFLHYFIAALRTMFNEACADTLALLQARQQPPQTILYNTFSNDLEKLPGEAILVLDDYHSIRGMEVHNLLSELMRHWPKPLHLMLISRISPPIPLTDLRAKGKISEIRTQDLRFTAEETAAYLRQAQFDILSQSTMRLLEERFEGWPAGLHLAALSWRSVGSQEAVLSILSSENHNITGYLVDEVLNHQFPAIHSFLLKTAILDRFCVSLCEAVIGEIDPAWNVRACLDWIQHSELFITPLDNRREWYRYHHLFRELLEQRLSVELTPDSVTSLHRLASTWFEQHGLIEEALQHAQAAGDIDLAAHQMSAGLCDVLNRDDRPTLERWLRLLPEEIIQRRPELLIIKVWVLQFLWKLDLQAKVIQQVEELLNSEGSVALPGNELQNLCGQILLLNAQHAFFNNQPTQAVELCRQVLAQFHKSWTFVRGGAMLYMGLSMQASGQALEAERLLLDEFDSWADKTDTYALRLLQTICFNYLNSGQLEPTSRIAQVLLQGATHRKLAIMKCWGDYFLGVVYYQRNELEAAAQHFSQIIENRFTAQITTYRDAVAGLALIYQIQNESTQAIQIVESISQYDLEQTGREDERTRSLRARLQLMQGDLEEAGLWVDSYTDPLPDQPLIWMEEPQVTRVRVLVTRGSDADLRQALQILEVLSEIAERTHNTRYKIEILALRAVVLRAAAHSVQGETDQVAAELRQAVELARAGRFIRIFIDLGKPMQELLLWLTGQGHAVELIGRILAAFPAEYSPLGDDKNLIGSVNPALRVRLPSPGIDTLAEPLTPRELEVMILLREPLSIKDIALRLNISYATVKRHTINIYSKLGVNHRWDAVSRAEDLNMLPTR